MTKRYRLNPGSVASWIKPSLVITRRVWVRRIKWSSPFYRELQRDCQKAGFSCCIMIRDLSQRVLQWDGCDKGHVDVTFLFWGGFRKSWNRTKARQRRPGVIYTYHVSQFVWEQVGFFFWQVEAAAGDPQLRKGPEGDLTHLESLSHNPQELEKKYSIYLKVQADS